MDAEHERDDDDRIAPPQGNFNYPTAYRIGCGRRREVVAACREFGLTAPLVIADPGIVEFSWFREVTEQIATAGLKPSVFANLRGNPIEQNVIDGVAAYHQGKHRGCLIIGGGSALDVGKCIALMVDHPGSVFDYEDIGDNWTKVDPEKVAPMIAMPTTAGTGSEVGRASVITDVRDHSKKIIFHPRMLPPLVLADPEMTFGLPAHLTAATGIDAFVHAFEAFCAPGYHPMADGIALEAMRLCARYLPRCVEQGDDAEARTHMMMASSMGATAFQKGLGLVHAMAHPLGAVTDIHHGLANAILLPYAMEHNRSLIEDKMIRLARALELRSHNFESVLHWVMDLRETLGIPHTLEQAQESGCMRNTLETDQLQDIAERATRDPSLSTNPKPCTADDIHGVLLAAWSGV